MELRIPLKKLKDYGSLVEDLDNANKEAFRDAMLRKRSTRKIEYSIATHFIKDGNPP